MDCSTPGFPVHHQLLELTQTHVHQVRDATQPSYPLSSPSPPAFNLSQHQDLFQCLGVKLSVRIWPKNIVSSSHVLHLLFLYNIHPLVWFLIPKNWLENPSLKSIHLIIFWSVNQLVLFSKGSFLLTLRAKVSKKFFLCTLKSHL